MTEETRVGGQPATAGADDGALRAHHLTPIEKPKGWPILRCKGWHLPSEGLGVTRPMLIDHGKDEMGTNYYLHQKPDCECCGRAFEPLHIGKSSGGWCFSLHVTPEDGISTLDDWIKLWQQPGAYVRNEYGERVPLDQMLEIVTNRGREKNWDDATWWEGFYRSERDFHERNHSERGPRGLLRHRIGPHCKAHGEGTWDCIHGEFS